MITLLRKRTLKTLSLSACLFAFGAAGCDESTDDEGSSASAGKGGSSSSSAGKGGAGGAGGKAAAGSGGSSGGGSCDSKKETKVTGDITKNTTWDCGTYLLQKLIYVTGDSTLTIKPGVQVLGDTDQAGEIAALIVTRGSKLDAVGTKDEPIVFSSGNPEGARAPGDWGGVVLLGGASINSGTCVGGTGDSCQGGHFESNVEGLDPTDPKAKFGGTDDDHDCGKLEYARIEYAGFQLSMDNELNGLTVGACGKKTKLSYVQVHRGSDDGIEFFGGTAGIDHAVLSAISDDGLDWDLGWRGNAQFVVIHQAMNDGDKGIEADNLGSNEAAAPRSKPTLYNFTMIGNPTKVALLLREGTQGVLRNFLVQGFATALDLAATSVNLGDDWPGALSVESSVFHDNKAAGDSDSMDDDKGFNEDEAVKAGDRKNVFDVDPGLGTSISEPNYKPGSDKLADKATPPSGFDTAAKYAGAVDPAGTDWTKGWTTYSSN
mgnify:FL=1